MTHQISLSPEAEHFAGLLKAHSEHRLTDAVEEGIIAEHDGIRLTRCVESTGQRFVKRVISRNSVVANNNAWVGFKGDLKDAWTVFTKALKDKNGPIQIIPSTVVDDDSGNLTILSEYRENVVGLESASLEMKVAVAKQLISLASLDTRYRFGLDCIAKDMFNVRFDQNSGETVEVIDVDPYLGSNFISESSYFSKHSDYTSRGAYIEKVINTFWGNWCTNDMEKVAVFSAITREIGDLLSDDECTLRNPVFEQLAVAQLMSNGLDTRQRADS